MMTACPRLTSLARMFLDLAFRKRAYRECPIDAFLIRISAAERSENLPLPTAGVKPWKRKHPAGRARRVCCFRKNCRALRLPVTTATRHQSAGHQAEHAEGRRLGNHAAQTLRR